MPQKQSDELQANVIKGSGLDDLWKALAKLDVSKAESSVEDDKLQIHRLIEQGPGFHNVNTSVSKYLQEWVLRKCEKHLDCLIGYLPVLDLVAGELHLCIGRLLRKISRDDMLERASLHLRQALKIQESQSSDSLEGDMRIPQILNELGSVSMVRGENRAAESYFERARQIYERLDELETEDALEVLMNIGAMQRRYGDKSKAYETFLEAHRIRERMGTLDTTAGSKLLTEIGHTLRRQDRSSEALEKYYQARSALQRRSLIATPDGAALLMSIGMTIDERFQQGDESTNPSEYYNEARRIREMTDTLDTPEGAKLLSGIGDSEIKRGNFSAARESLLTAKRVFEETDTLYTAAGAFAMTRLGDAYSGEGSWKEAFSTYELAFKIREKIGTADKKKGAELKSKMEHAEERAFRAFHVKKACQKFIRLSSDGSGSRKQYSTFMVEVLKTPGDNKLGIRCRGKRDCKFLTVTAVKNGGLIDQWNKIHPEARVKADDQIHEVNGSRGGEDELYKAIGQADEVKLKITRIVALTQMGE